jgi:hypothetical protein
MRPSISACLTEEAVRYVRTDLTNDSLYARLAAHFCVHHNSLREIGLQSNVFHQPLFRDWLPHWDKNLGAFLGCSAEEVGRMRGIDLTHSRCGLTVSHDLRFCRSCLSQGYHSIVFQHWALHKCPYHEEALLNACPQCRRSITPSVASVLEFPYLCSNCGMRLSSLAMQRRRTCDPRELDTAPLAWRRLLADAATHPLSIAVGRTSQFARSTAAVVSRKVQRAFLFAAPAWGPQCAFQTQVVSVGRDEIDRSQVPPWVSVTLAVEGLAPLLRWFSRECPGADEACALYWQLRRPDSGIRLNMEVSVLGALLCKTLYCYVSGQPTHLDRAPEA